MPGSESGKYADHMVRHRVAPRTYYHNLGATFLETTNIQVTMGRIRSNFVAMFATCEAGDEIVVFEPFYTNYNSYAMFINHARSGFDNRSQRISPADGYEIEKKITGKTKAVLIHTEYRHRLFKGRDGDAGYPRQKHGLFYVRRGVS